MLRTKRHKFSQTYRLRIAWAQGWRCRLCQDQLHYTFEVDHIHPLFDGGTNDESNLQAICAQCHRVKTQEERAPVQTKLSTYRQCMQCKAIYSSYFRHQCTGVERKR